MAKQKISGYQETIRQLFDADKNAAQLVDEARRKAESTIDKARKESKEIIEAARSDANSEAETIIREARKKAEGAPGTPDRSKDLLSLRRNAQENKDRAVDFLVAWVTAETD